jgi:ABC-2 type transport system ATP-binding protein
MSDPVFDASGLSKAFGHIDALREVTLSLSGPSIIGLLGRNAAGKTTLLRHIVGLQLPTAGTAHTFGVPTRILGHEQLAKIGVVTQTPAFLEWMTVGRQLRYLSAFYPRWDVDREAHLLELLELDGTSQIKGLSTGSVQKLAIVAALCHHPTLLLLDEPVSNLDPIVRDRFLKFLLEVVQEDAATIVVSSHVLHDVESVVDWIVCLNEGRVVANAALDDLKEQYAEWRVTARTRDLPAHFEEGFVVHETAAGRRTAKLVVRCAGADLAAFRQRHDADVEVAPLNLQGLFPVLVNGSAH